MFDLTNGFKSENNNAVHYASEWLDYRLDECFHGRLTLKGNAAIYLLSLGALKLSKLLFRFQENKFAGTLKEKIGTYHVSVNNNYDSNVCVTISATENQTGMDCFFNIDKRHVMALCEYLRTQANVK